MKSNLDRFGLLDDQVRFLKGFFKDTLPSAPIESISVLRLDGDLYESTTQCLEALYSRVSPGGYVIVDDYSLPPCRMAVESFFQRCSVRVDIHEIDGSGVYWQVREAGVRMCG